VYYECISITKLARECGQANMEKCDVFEERVGYSLNVLVIQETRKRAGQV